MLFAVVGTGIPALAAQDAATVLRHAERTYQSLTSLRAQFRQTISNPMLGDPETTRGELFLVPPDRFAMRFAQPPGDRIVADGEWLWAYTPSSVPGQVIRRPVPTSGTDSPNLLAQFVERPLDRYSATYSGRDTIAGDAVELVRLVPLRPDLGFREATIGVSERTGLLRSLSLVEDSGQRRRLVFVEIDRDAAIPRAELTFVVPRGVRVVTP